MTKVTPPSGEGNPWEFAYDGQLNRYWINRGGTERYLLWDGLNCLEERNASDGSLHARYTYGYTQIYGIGSCVEIYKPGSPDKWYTLIMDHRGTAYAILDENGAEIGRRQYDAFGVILSQTGTWPTDLAYQTNWQTIQIGNKWWGLSAARMYEFDTGRFTQRDPAYGTNSTKQSVLKNNLLEIINESQMVISLYILPDIINGVDPSGAVWRADTSLIINKTSDTIIDFSGDGVDFTVLTSTGVAVFTTPVAYSEAEYKRRKEEAENVASKIYKPTIKLNNPASAARGGFRDFVLLPGTRSDLYNADADFITGSSNPLYIDSTCTGLPVTFPWPSSTQSIGWDTWIIRDCQTKPGCAYLGK